DLQAAYLQEDGQKTDFVRTSSANEWVEYLGKTEQFNDQIDYWTSRETSMQGKEQGALALETLEDSQVCSEHRTIDPGLTDKLLTQAHESFNTQTNDLLLFALARALKDSHGQQDSLIFLEGHGREDLNEGIDLSRTMGWFTSMYPVAITAGVDDDLSTQLKHFKEQQREIPDKGLGFGVLKYLQKTIDKDYCPTASFNYLGQFENTSVTNKEQEQEQPKLFELSSLKTAKTNADHLALTCPVDIVAHVESGQLQLAVFYSYSLEHQTLVNALLDSYVEHLQQIIGFCCDTDDFNLTPSDIDFDGFDIDSLDAVLDNL
ncbi:MAG: condensation domain-containing protein, partial [Psychrosphaera sp.]|nr:condensation domain-containing protein [Psychrosphaera sp.]